MAHTTTTSEIPSDAQFSVERTSLGYVRLE